MTTDSQSSEGDPVLRAFGYPSRIRVLNTSADEIELVEIETTGDAQQVDTEVKNLKKDLPPVLEDSNLMDGAILTMKFIVNHVDDAGTPGAHSVTVDLESEEVKTFFDESLQLHFTEGPMVIATVHWFQMKDGSPVKKSASNWA